jgi:ABC-type glycerol-3-phosphate transport system substrate-binding protein
MKHTARFLAFLLVLVMMLTAVACGGTKEPAGEEITTTAAPEQEATTTTAVAETESPYDKDGYLKSDLPEDLSFGGETVTVLYWEDVEHVEFESEEITGDIVKDAIYTRNIHVEEKLGVTLAFQQTKGDNSNIAAFKNFVGNAYTAGERDYDLIASYSRTTAACAQAGYCLDLLSLDYLNFENPWWPASLIDIVGIGDSMYFASGDASVNVLHMMYCTLYNKDLITEYNLQDPVELVRSGKWTLEAMQTMSKDIYQDLDNDGRKSQGDFFGTTVGSYHIDALYTGSGLRLVEQGEGDNLMIVSQDFFSEKAIALCDNLGAWLATNDVYDSTDTIPFVTGKCVFDINRCRTAASLQGVDWSYGVLPVPKYDEAQENYISVMGNPFTLYAIYANTKDANRAAAVLECWASEAYRTTTPAQFETTMKLKYSESEVEAEMFDIIRSTVCFDMGRLFNPNLANITDIFYGAVDNGSSWAAISKGYTKTMPKLIQKISDAFLAQQG